MFGNYHEQSTNTATTARRFSPKNIALLSGGLLLVIALAFQLLYPSDTLLPFTKIDGIAVGAKKQAAVASELDAVYAAVKVPVYFSSDDTVKVEPRYADIGVNANNSERVKQYNYPWYIRLIPSSVLWYGFVDKTNEPEVRRSKKVLEGYIAEHFGSDCKLKPVNATIQVAKSELKVVPSVNGGECDYDELHAKLEKVPVQLQPDKIVVKGTTIEPIVSDAKAEAEMSRAQNIIDAGLTLRVADAEHKVSKDKVYEWLSYSVKDDELVAMLNAKKAETWLQDTYGKQLAVSPGVTTVVTRDFTELSRKTGKTGQAIDAGATRQALEEQLQGKTIVSKAVTKTISPTVAYERSYSPTDRGISALLKNFAADHAGSYAMTYIELDGKKRRAEYQGDKQFVTASTYKLFAAYSLLKRVDDGRETWSANADCFDKMIRVSDNPCAEAYLSTFGLTAITNEIQSIGLKNSNFTVRGGPFTTANDLALLLGQLQAKQNFSTLGRDRLLSAMRANIFRQGIPAGSKGQVANKVGFLDGLLHDAAIVYTSSGTYILVVLSDGSSWQNIAELTRQIEKIR